MVQPKDDVPYTFPMILNPKVVLQVPKIDEDLYIRVHHDLVELSMMAEFQQVDSKSFVSHAFMLIIVEIPFPNPNPNVEGFFL